MSALDLNRDPFGSDIVTSPREIEPAVEGLNDAPLRQLVARFKQLAQGPVPRLRFDHSALLVLSPQPGHGKSHLIGRLFRELDDDATLLYLRPFQDFNSCWVSLLEKAVTELDCPDAADKVQPDPGEPTQLDILVRRVLMAMMTPLLRDKRVRHPDPEQALELFRRYPQTALELPGFREWIQTERTSILHALDDLLRSAEITLSPNRISWLKVLLAYAYSEDDRSLRQLCLDWITYRELEPAEGKALGLRPAELPEADLPYEQRNEKCFERLKDLFVVGAYYRPFLLCFDQTELYGTTPELARAFGVVVSRLRRETCNQLSIVTANQSVWYERVFKYFEVADQHALDPRPIELEGMNQAQAEQLIRNRLSQWEAEDGADDFCGRVVPALFKEHPRRSVRDVLRGARSAWRADAPDGKNLVGPNMADIFESYRLKLLATPKGLAFDAGVLQWAVQNVLGPAVGATVASVKSPKGHLTLEWRDGKRRRELFGFEGGYHWKRWEAIIREASKYRRDADSSTRVRANLFRVPRQKSLSERTHQQIREHATSVHIVNLELQEVAKLFAAHDLLADIKQGNQDIGESQCLQFVRTELRGVAERIWHGGHSIGSVPPPDNLARVIEAIVKAKRFVTLHLLRAQLTEPHDTATDEDIVTAASNIKHIKIHIAPASKVFQWLQ